MLTLGFLICALMTVILSIFMVSRRQPVSAAMVLVVIMLLLAGMYGLLNAHFSAVAQVIVYAGAIMVVFVFVIMLLNLPAAAFLKGRLTVSELVLIVLGLITAIFFGTRLHLLVPQLHLKMYQNQPLPFIETENVKNVSALMFTKYLWQFEIISFLILVAIIGAVMIAKKETQK